MLCGVRKNVPNCIAVVIPCEIWRQSDVGQAFAQKITGLLTIMEVKMKFLPLTMYDLSTKIMEIFSRSNTLTPPYSQSKETDKTVSFCHRSIRYSPPLDDGGDQKLKQELRITIINITQIS